MNKVRIKNFRCFGDSQEAVLAPLTLLVGDNSTGKTSFMGVIRVLWDMLYRQRVPDFKEAPYDLGSFASLVHDSMTGDDSATTFELGLEYSSAPPQDSGASAIGFNVEFGKNGTAPVPVRFRLFNAQEGVWIDHKLSADSSWELSFGTPRGSWTLRREVSVRMVHDRVWPFVVLMDLHLRRPDLADDEKRESRTVFDSMQDGPDQPNDEDRQLVNQLCNSQLHPRYFDRMLYASAPVRSQPRRTYDPTRLTHEPGGDDIPTYLASLASQKQSEWTRLKTALGQFGVESGLFDEIAIRSFGDTANDPFQLQIRESGTTDTSPHRNLIDVGYGVSQVLPVITELLRDDAFPVFLFQQPEVHLHPRAQAALGNLFCRTAGPNRILVVETHSDHLMDRIRMNVRDGVGSIGPEDVSILFFERSASEVKIHSIRLDLQGNVLGAPSSYRRFFMDEVHRSLGL